jgi:hypothetical protein
LKKITKRKQKRLENSLTSKYLSNSYYRYSSNRGSKLKNAKNYRGPLSDHQTNQDIDHHDNYESEPSIIYAESESTSETNNDNDKNIYIDDDDKKGQKENQNVDGENKATVNKL